ncbi:FAD-binding domain-containing protein [Plenodomus tracheiphilus IPT5]|uniref:FAD-binding domain-containing protein n=1 Tax=Plenodomus tracheiphilus IPT5 TaxID=1408161 RepID=A0A6A7BCX4_9PLEO|nr:FAD-binding domain-containing protein [Plenodomus tracheiphilus IPT5]
MEAIMRLTLATLLLTAQSVSASPTPATTQACTEIKNALPGKVLAPKLLALEYGHEQQQYWSTTLRSVDPACIVQPVDAHDVSVVVKILNKYPSVPFATRSGGHDPNVGHATVQDGVLITMTDMVGATYDAEKHVAYVKPGGEWNDVISDLEPSGVTIAGGRLGLVGVGGLLLGGGLSFLSAQEGLAADNIIGWETVVANGTVVNVDAKANPELAQAMRGSGGQFGIVTKFTVNVHPIGDVWGGFCTYDPAQDTELYAALHQYAGNGSAADPKSAIIFTDLVAAGGLTTKVVYYFYDGPARPTSGPFADFFKIPSLTCLPKTQKYSELLKSNGEPVRLLNARAFFRTVTVPYIPSRPQMYAEIRDKLQSIVSPFLTIPPLIRGVQFSVDFQPLPSIIGTHSAAKGGNAMGLTASDPERIIIILQGAWNLASDDALVYDFGKQITDWLDVQVPKWLDEAGMKKDIYLPLFINDASSDQLVMQSYRGYEKFKALQRSVDPKGLFATRAGGFKY